MRAEIVSSSLTLVILPWLVIQVSSSLSSSYLHPYPPASVMDEDDLLQNLYKRLSQMDPADLQGLDAYNTITDDQIEDEGKAPDIRDPEYLEHSSNSGFIYMSGGAGEGKQHLTPDGSVNNVHQVKSDESLPFYCHPPNPCPKGFTSSDGCQEFVEDTAEYQKEWINKMQKKGMCSCDEEHMFDCSSSSKIAGTERKDEDKELMNDVLNKLLEEKHEINYGGQKRVSLVAKKSPRIKREVSNNRMEQELERMSKRKERDNPYLSGDRLHTIAKKGSKGSL